LVKSLDIDDYRILCDAYTLYYVEKINDRSVNTLNNEVRNRMF
jgi:hypothetical protein